MSHRSDTYLGYPSPGFVADEDAELAALRRGFGLLRRPWRSLIEVSGADRVRFLNGRVTCDVAELGPGEATRGFFADIKGRILADVTVLADGDRLLLDVPAGEVETLIAHLEKYVLVDRVDIGPGADRAALALFGPEAADRLDGLPLEPWTLRRLAVDGREAVIAREADVGTPRWSLWVVADDADGLIEALVAAGATLAGHKAWETLRVVAGHPVFGRDYGPANFPQETGLEDAVSYTKGCYLGQEVIARIHYRGGVQRRLVGLSCPDGAKPGQRVLHDGRPAGELTSVARDQGTLFGLAILHRRAEDGAAVEIEGAGPAQVIALPA